MSSTLAENPPRPGPRQEALGRRPDLQVVVHHPDHVKPAIMAAVDKVNAESTRSRPRSPSAPRHPGQSHGSARATVRGLNRPWGSSPTGRRDGEALRAAYDECQPAVVTASFESVNRAGYGASWRSRASVGYLTDAQKRAVECEVRDAQLSGVALDGAQKDRYNEIAKELSELSTKFSNNVLDATKAFAHS